MVKQTVTEQIREAHGGTGLGRSTNGRQTRQCFVNNHGTCQEGFFACRRNAKFKLTRKHASWTTMATNASVCELLWLEFVKTTDKYSNSGCAADMVPTCDYPSTYFSREWNYTQLEVVPQCCDCAKQLVWKPEIALSIIGLPFFLYLVHLYIHAGSHSERDIDHASKVRESREIINSFGLGVEEEDIDVYDTMDFEFVRTAHILTFLKMFFVSKIYRAGIDAWNVLQIQMERPPSPCHVGDFDQGLNRFTACNIGLPKSTGQATTFMHSWFVVFLLFIVYNVLVGIFLPFLRQCFAKVVPFVPRYDRGSKKVVYRFSLRGCCRSPSRRSRSVRKIMIDDYNYNLREIKKIVKLTYVALYPFALDQLLDGLYCMKESKTSVLDNKTPCADAQELSIIYVIIWMVPALVMIFIVAKAAYSNMETDAHFLHNWGFLVIGLKPTYMWWQLLEFFEISLYLGLYVPSTAGYVFPNVFKYCLNFIIATIKVALLKSIRPYESTEVHEYSLNTYIMLQILHFLGIMIQIMNEENFYEKKDGPIVRALVIVPGVFFCLVIGYYLFIVGFWKPKTNLCRILGMDNIEGDDGNLLGSRSDLDSAYLKIPDKDLTIRTQDGKLGAGGAGSVYKADWKQDSTPVAAKELNVTLMNEEDAEEFDREVKNLIRANHRAVINFYGICDKTDANLNQTRRYIVMEYAANGSLEDLLEKAGKSLRDQLAEYSDSARRYALLQILHPFDSRQILTWAMDIASALQYLNSKNMPHRDVKPHNIFLTAQNNVKIGDLGFSKLTRTVEKDGGKSGRKWWHSDQVAESVARSPSIGSRKIEFPKTPVMSGGTPEYMAPESFGISPDDWGEKIDVWSFGVVLKRIISFEQPFPHGSITRGEMLVDVPAGRARPFQHLKDAQLYYAHPMMKSLIDHCLQFDPKKRPNFSIIVHLLKKMKHNPYLSPKPSQDTRMVRARSRSSVDEIKLSLQGRINRMTPSSQSARQVSTSSSNGKYGGDRGRGRSRLSWGPKETRQIELPGTGSSDHNNV